MSIHYRKATEADLPDLLPLLQSLFALEEDFTFSAELQLRGMQLLLESPQAVIIIALNQKSVAGMISGQLTISTAEGGASLLIEDLVIAEFVRGNGIGRKLLEEIGKWGRSHNALRMQLLADKNNLPALEFYQHLGWSKTNLIGLRNYYAPLKED